MEKFITIERKRKVNEEIIEKNNNDVDEIVTDLKSKTSRKTFNLYWELDEELRKWIKEGPNHLPFCKICCVELKAAGGKGDLLKHAQTPKHKKNGKAVTIHEGSKEVISGLAIKTCNAEIKLAAFCAEHNIAFLAMDHLAPLIRNTFADAKVAEQIACKRTKTTAIVKNVIGDAQLDFLFKLMNLKCFSLCADESTDCSTTKLLSLVVRLEHNDKVFDFCLTCIEIIQCDAQGIYNAIVNFFDENNINYKQNLIGFAADGANVMSGGNKSVVTLLKKDCPNLISVKCTCHSLALCSSKACGKLPEFVESTVRDIYNFIANSPKRVALFSSLQTLLDIKPVKLLHPSQTRWLSLEAAVTRVLDQLEVLKLFFIHEDVVKLESSQRILKNLEAMDFKTYLTFLKFVLSEINKVNRIFQSESPQVHTYNQTLRNLLLLFLDNFTLFDEHDLKTISEIKLPSSMIKSFDELYFGAEVELLMCQMNDDLKKICTENCLNFYVVLCNEIIKRLDVNDNTFESLEILAPVNVIQKKNQTIAKLAANIPFLKVDNVQVIDSEWRKLRNIDFKILELTETCDIEMFWKKILSLKHADGTLCYPELKKIIWTVLTIPISTANVERTFSQININKTKIRNRLSTETLVGILRTKDYIKKNSMECYSLQHDDNLIKKYNSNTLYYKKKT